MRLFLNVCFSIYLVFFTCFNFAEASENTFARIELPITFDEFGLATIELEIAGKVEKFTLDTGSREGLHLPKAIMDKVENLKLTGEKRYSLDLTGKEFSNDRFVIEQLNVKGMIFRDVAGVEYEDWGLSLSDSDDDIKLERPVLGLGFFKDYRLIIDYSQKVLIVEDKKQIPILDNLDKWINLPFLLKEEGVIIQMNYQSNVYDLCLDTGASVSMITAKVLPNNVILQPCSIIYPDIEMKDCNLVFLEVENIKSDLKVHALVYGQFPEKFEVDGLLGKNFLEQFLVLIDLKSEQLMLKPIK